MDTEETDPVFGQLIRPMAMAAEANFKRNAGDQADNDLTNIPQTIRLATQVKVVFELE